MSKCQVEIEFDRETPAYAPGELVTGTIRVEANLEVACRGLIIEHYWQTHGQGNRAGGSREQREFPARQLYGGEVWSERFSFTAPAGPPTYHGHFLNVDHYVAARVSLAWAVDPAATAEYHLAADGSVPAADDGPTAARMQGMFQQYGWMIATGLMVAGVICPPAGIVLVPLGFYVLYLSLRKQFAEKRLGPVELDLPGRHVEPGMELPISIAFTPRKTVNVQSATARLHGQEECISGSGTDKKTHRHTLHEQLVSLSGPARFAAGEPVRWQATLGLPATEAYSFTASDNRIDWKLTVRINLPGWPDWLEEVPLVMVASADPGSLSGATTAEKYRSGMFAGELPHNVEFDASAERAISESPGLDADDVLRSAEIRLPVSGAPLAADVARLPAGIEPQRELERLLHEIHAADRFGSAREDRVTAALDSVFRLELDVEDNSRTYREVPDDRYRQGRTLRGRLYGTDYLVEALCLADRNGELQDLRMGDRVWLDAAPWRWNGTFDRLEMCEQE